MQYNFLNKISFYLFFVQVAFFNIYIYHALQGNILNIKLIDQLFPLISIVILIIPFIFRFKDNLNLYSILFIFLIIYLLFISSYNYAFYKILNEEIHIKYYIIQLLTIIQYLFFFLIGFYFQNYYKYRHIIFIMYTILVINILLNIDFSIHEISLIHEHRGIYLFLGDTFAIWSILTLSFLRTNLMRFIVIMITMATLYVLISRTSFFMFIIILPVYLLWIGELKKMILFFPVVVLFLAVYILQNNLDILESSRMFSYFYTGEDQSLSEREIYFGEGLNSIYENWFIGDYGGDVISHEGTGYYMHNILQLLRQYGYIPFLIFCFFVLQLIYASINIIRFSDKYNENYLFFILITIYTLLEILFLRALGSGSAYIFFSIGFLVASKKLTMRSIDNVI